MFSGITPDMILNTIFLVAFYAGVAWTTIAWMKKKGYDMDVRVNKIENCQKTDNDSIVNNMKEFTKEFFEKIEATNQHINLHYDDLSKEIASLREEIGYIKGKMNGALSK